MNLFEDLKWRGLVKDISSPDIEKLLNGEPISFIGEQTQLQIVCI